MSGFNRRQIVQQLWQKERADKFIWEKLLVGMFAGQHQSSQKSAPSLAGTSTASLPPDPFIHVWHRAFLSRQPVSCFCTWTSRNIQSCGDRNSTARVRVGRMNKSRLSPWWIHVHCPLPQSHSTPFWLWDKTVPQGQLWVIILKSLGLWP